MKGNKNLGSKTINIMLANINNEQIYDISIKPISKKTRHTVS